MLTVILAGMVLNGTLDAEEADYMLVYLAKSEVPEGTHAVVKTVALMKEAREAYAIWKNSPGSLQSFKKSAQKVKIKKNSSKPSDTSSKQ